MEQTGGTWVGGNVERKPRQNGARLRPVADWTRRLAAYKPKREVLENKIKIKK
jgi:hypothetical protein